MTTQRRSAALLVALLALAVAGAGAWLRLGVLVDAQRSTEHHQRVLAEVGRLAVLANAADQIRRAQLSDPAPGAPDAARPAGRATDATTAALARSLTALAVLTRSDPVQQRIVQDIRATEEAEDRFGRTIALAGAMHDHERMLLDRELSRGAGNAEDALQQVAGLLICATLLVATAWWLSRSAKPAARPTPAGATRGTVTRAGPTRADAAAAGRADAERHLAGSPLTAEEVRGALAG